MPACPGDVVDVMPDLRSMCIAQQGTVHVLPPATFRGQCEFYRIVAHVTLSFVYFLNAR